MKSILIVLLSIFSLEGFSTELTQDSLKIINDSSGNGRKPVLLALKSSKVVNYGLPALFTGYGLMSLNNKTIQGFDQQFKHEILENQSHFSTHLDDKLQFAPLVAVYSLNVIGIKGKSNFFDRTAIYIMSNIIMSHSVDFLKNKTHKQRPSMGDYRSFPSGHTTIAFGAAEFMRMEFKDVSPWYGYAAYTVATTTGALRMLNNQHWFSDVVAGAGIGILSTKVSYIVYPWLKRKIAGEKALNIQASPTIQNGALGYSFVIPL